MAVTKWLDPDNWTLEDWTDSSLTVLVDALWSTLKGAADERQAFFEQSHSSGFDADNEFPTMGIFRSGATDPNNAEIIRNAVFPYYYSGGSAEAGPIDAESIEADGTAVTAASRAVVLNLVELMQDIFNYTENELLHIVDTDSGSGGSTGFGKATAILRMAWIKQWFQVMDYPVYYNVPLGHLSGLTGFNGFWDFFEEIQQVQSYRIELMYGFPTDESTEANIALDELTEPTTGSTPVNFYTAGDLDDLSAGVYSTNQEIFDYVVGKFNEFYEGADWQTLSNPNDMTGIDLLTTCFMYSRTTNLGLTEQSVDISQSRRVRFKIKEAFRALSPEKFTPLIYHYFYMSKGTSGEDPANHFYSDFGSGINENETKLKLLTLDSDGYYYFNLHEPDFSGYTVPDRPIITPEDNRRQERNQIFTLINDATLGTNRHSVLVKPNLTDGTAFEYYTE
jgi:hypothetical protein